ncbi:MAG: ATP-grasp domain-containing protein [Acidimicrobiales bacterium]
MDHDFPALFPLGIVGAGQIARMMHQAAIKFGITPHLLAEHADDSAALAAPNAVFGHPDSLAAFADSCSVVTFEHERLDIGLIERLEASGAVIRPGSKTLRAAFDKAYQRRVLLGRGFPIPAFAEFQSPDDLLDFASVFGWPLVIKSSRAGVEGQRSVWIVGNRSEAMRVISEQSDRPLLLESFQHIVKELVVLVARRPGGNSRCYPVIEQINVDGVASEFRTPATIGHAVATDARSLALRVADELDATGLVAIELFLTNGGLIVNEIAARPHNAGHLTIEGAATSQFENHVRAVLDLPLGPTWLRAPAVVTKNVIGGRDLVDPARGLADALAVEGTQVHLYGKRHQVGSKLGHVTALADDIELAEEMASRSVSALLGRRPW